MTAVGVTGHQDLGPTTEALIEPLIMEHLRGAKTLVGVSSLASGADQLFARCVRRCGGELVAIIPSADYAAGFPPEGLRSYERLLAEASEVVQLPYQRASEQAYMAAGQEVVRRSQELFAVWDGKPAGGLGGTADVVRFAHETGVSVRVIWPLGAQRG